MILRTTLVFSLLSACSFIDDFDFEVGDAAVVDSGDSPDAQPEDALGGDADTVCDGDCYELAASFLGAGPWDFQRQDPDFELLEQEDGMRNNAPSRVAPGGGLPAHTYCADGSGELCAGVLGWLLVETSHETTNDAAIVFTAPESGNYEFSLERMDIGGATTVDVSRNRPWDEIRRLESGSAIFTVDLFEGDSLRIVVGARDELGVDAFRATATRIDDPQHCQSVVRFDDEFVVECGTGTLVEDGRQAGGGEARATTAGTGVVGGSRVFRYEAALRLDGQEFDYSGDFTMQMWIRVEGVGAGSTYVFSDWAFGEPVGGVQFELDYRNLADVAGDVVRVGYVAPAGSIDVPNCDSERCIAYIEHSVDGDSGWHFYRLVRDTARDEVRLCVDGQLVGRRPLPGAVDITPGGGRFPSFGRQGRDFREEPTFEGAIDDFRMIGRALPCGAR